MFRTDPADLYFEIETPEVIETPVLRDLFVYWNGLRRGRPMPMRPDLDPVDIPALLPHIGLIDVVAGDPAVFRYRLVGTEMVRMFGRDMTGKTTDDVPHPGLRRMVSRAFERCRVEAKPLRQKWFRPWDSVMTYERVMLPLGGARGEVAMILISAVETHTGAFAAAFDTVGRRD